MSLLDLFKTKSISEVEQKAANIESNKMSFELITGTQLKSVANLTPKELIQYNTNYVEIANNKNATTCATLPLKLYYQTNGKRVVNDSIPVKGKNNVVEILNHPFLDLIKNVNEDMNYTDLASLTFGYLGLIGNMYWYVEKDGKGMPINIYPLLSEHVTLKLNESNGKIMAYKYFDKVFPTEDIIQFSNYQPGSLISGKGELEACISAARRYCYYDFAEAALNSNNARPDFVVSYKTKLTENEQKDVSKIWSKKFGSKGIGKPLVTSDVDIKPMSLAPKDMEWLEGRKSSMQEIINSFGIPESLLFINSSNYASSYTAVDHYMRYTIFPKMDRYCEKINEKLLPLYDEGLYIDYDRTITPNPVEQANVLKTYVDAGIITINEAREKIGMQPLEDMPIKQLEV